MITENNVLYKAIKNELPEDFSIIGTHVNVTKELCFGADMLLKTRKEQENE